jgi:uncharacterized protein (TIGR03000 family)
MTSGLASACHGGGRTVYYGGRTVYYGGQGYGYGYRGLGYGYGGYGYAPGYGSYGYGPSLVVPVAPSTYPPLTIPATGVSAAATITVVTNAGAKVTFDGIESDQTGTRHSFTTKPIAAGAEARVQVKVDGSSISIGVRAGEKATVDMRK